MSQPPRDVSVIIPACNAARFIREAIDSVFQQVGPTVEVIVVDNRSTDHTREVVKEAYGDSVLLTSEPTPGCASARNTGIQLATGRYIALLDADDVWSPDKLQRQAEALLSRGNEGLVFCYGREFLDPNLTDQQQREWTCRPEPYAYLAPSALFCARAAFDRVGMFPDVPFGEFIAWFAWAKFLGLESVILPEVLVQRRVHAANSSRDPKALAGYTLSAKWLLDRRRQAQAIRER